MRIAFWTIPSMLAIASIPGSQICSAAVNGFHPAPTTFTGGCTGLPYSAKETTTYPTHTANGIPIEHQDVHLLWRDAEGRTRNELVAKTASGAEYRSVMVYEPIKRVYWSWVVGNGSARKVAHVRPFGDSEGPVSCWEPPKENTVWHDPVSGTTTTIEILPPDNINGIAVIGNRKTTLTPAGVHDNKSEIKMTREFWVSPDLRIVVRHTIDSASTGKIIAELSDIKRSVPDPALFKVPDGYEMRVDPPPPPSVLDEIMRDVKPVLSQPPLKQKTGSTAFP
jgi:hypothetical protein